MPHDIDLQVVGQSYPHDSAVLHVQGMAQYVDDRAEPEGTLHVVPGYARGGVCGAITMCDLAAVKAAAGVVAVLTAADIPGLNDCSPALGDDPVLADGRITFHGQVIFAVVAKSRAAARKAARLARIEIAAEPPAITVEEALAMGTADVVPPYAFETGGAAQALATAVQQVAEQFHIGGQEHFYLEGQVSLAIPEEQGGMTLHVSTQHPTEVQHNVAKMLGVADHKITCICRRMGGGFGGKETQAAQWAALAALAAAKTGKPAKCRLDRDDDMMMTGKRHDVRVDYRAGFDESGLLTAVDVDFMARCGVSADLSQGVCDRTMFHADNAYFYPDYHIRSRRLRTNTVSNTAFRGFGGPQGMLFAERMMDVVAITLGLDPLDVRKTNLYAPMRDRTPYHQTITDHVLLPLIEELELSSDYRARRLEVERFNQRSPILKKGLALTPVKFGISFTLTHLNQAGALLHVYSDGSVQISHGGTEMGQGLYVKVAQVVAEEFGLPLAQVRSMATATDKVPNTSPTAASSGTDLNGMAALHAARQIKQRMVRFAAAQWQVAESNIRFAKGEVLLGEVRRISFASLAKAMHVGRQSLSATGFYATPDIHWDREKAAGHPFFYYACGASCSEVTIDTMTGELTVDRVDILHDAGKSLNPAIDMGQIEGGFVQGMGWLTTEELVFDGQGRLATHAPSTYKIPCASDVPADFRVALYNSNRPQPDTIYQSKAVGEPPLMLAISVWCAINNAIASLAPGKVPALQAPATPEAIVRAIRSLNA